jgi:sporulation protein YlmC with PRC-barrel domain
MEVRLELLLSKPVVDSEGEHIGHIEEFRAVADQGRYQVVEVETGSGGLLKRLVGGSLNMAGLGFLAPKRRDTLRIPWRLLDLSDPLKPRLKCKRSEL